MIKIEHLSKNYGSFCAVDDISFEIGEGEIVGFLGPNGAGKSTTMNMLTGYLSSSSGKISVAGYDIQKSPLQAKKFIGYLPEQPPLYLDMTVREYLNFGYDLKGCKLDREQHLAEICEVTGVGDVYGKMLKKLSKGYKQRVGIAQALIGNPDVIILDEPTVGLDPKQIIEIRNLIRNLGASHTVILSTHILGEVQAVCDRIIIINKGRIVADEKTENISAATVGARRRFCVKVCGPSKEVMAIISGIDGVSSVNMQSERDGEAFVYTVECERGIDIRKSLFFRLADKGFAIIGLEGVGVSLEDIFISVVDKPSDEAAARAAASQGGKKRKRSDMGYEKRAEAELADKLFEDAARKRKEYADIPISDDDDDDDEDTENV